MSISDIGLIVTDLDGTLLGKGSRLLPENGEALRLCAERGIPVAIASGRLAGVCSRIAREMGVERCHILGLNGAHCLTAPFGAVEEMHGFSGELRAKCLEILRREGCAFNLYTDGGVYTNQPLDAAGQERFRGHFRDSGCEVVLVPDAAERAHAKPCLKLLVKQTNGAAAYERAKAALGALPEVYLTTSKADNFEVMLRGVGKAEAVEALARRMGVPMAQVAAFGDYDNDLPMLRACGCSVAMGNALPEVAAAALYQTTANDAGGVAFAIRHILAGDWEALGKKRNG